MWVKQMPFITCQCNRMLYMLLLRVLMISVFILLKSNTMSKLFDSLRGELC
jgi:hypothetical protein